MNTLRYAFLFAAALFALTAAADAGTLDINGKDGLTAWQHNDCRYGNGTVLRTEGFVCYLGPGKATLVTFRDAHKNFACAFHVANRGSTYRDRWIVDFFQDNPGRCSLHWTSDSSVDVHVK